MRRDIVQGDPASFVAQENTFQLSTFWKPKTLRVINATSNPYFLAVGNKRIPSRTSYDKAIPPGESFTLPVEDVQEFAGFLPLTPALTDTSQVVQLIFQD